MAANHRTAGEKVDDVTRQTRAVELCSEGLTFDEIAVKLGYADRSGAYKAVMAVLTRAEYAAADGLRAVMGARLTADEVRLIKIWTDDGLTLDQRLKAFDRLLRLRERVARLFGLDAPVKVEGFIRDETTQAIIELSEQLGMAAGPIPVE